MRWRSRWGQDGDGGDVDDSASARRSHRLDDLFDGPHGAGEVDVDDLVPDFVGKAVDVGEVDGFVVSAVVHQNMYTAELVDRGGDGSPDLVEVGNVAGDGNSADASGAHRLGDLGGLVGLLAYPTARLTPASASAMQMRPPSTPLPPVTIAVLPCRFTVCLLQFSSGTCRRNSHENL